MEASGGFLQTAKEYCESPFATWEIKKYGTVEACIEAKCFVQMQVCAETQPRCSRGRGRPREAAARDAAESRHYEMAESVTPTYSPPQSLAALLQVLRVRIFLRGVPGGLRQHDRLEGMDD